MHRKPRSLSMLLAVIFSVVLTAAGCTDSSTSSDGIRVAGGKLVDLQTFAGGDPDHIDPALASDIPSSQIAALVYQGLSKIDEHGEAQLGVAEEVNVSSDAKVWTFRLREDAAFSNGDLVHPSDFKFAWERVLDSRLGSPLVSMFDLIVGSEMAASTGRLSGVVADDDARTLVVTLKEPYREFLSQVSLPVYSPLPKRSFDVTPSLLTAWETTAMIGNGSFKMKSPWERGQRIVLLRNDTYDGGEDAPKAYVNEIEFRISKDLNSAYTDFQSGNGNVARIPAGQYKDAQSRYGADVVNTPLMGTEYWAFNMSDPVVGGSENQKLREAIALAVDKADMVEKVYNGARRVADSWAPPSTPGYEADETTGFDVARAKSLLVEWGRTPPALKVSFNSGAGHEEKAAIIVQNLNAVGIPATADPLDLDTYRRAVGGGSLQFFRGAWNADFASYDNLLQPLFHGDSIGGQNVFAYRSAQFDKLIDKARVESDDEMRAKLYRQAEVQMLQDRVVVPIDWTTASLVKSPNVQDLTVLPFGHIAYDRVWIRP